MSLPSLVLNGHSNAIHCPKKPTNYPEFILSTDTIPGRQCMASCFFLLKQFEDVLIYLNSIKVHVAMSPLKSPLTLVNFNVSI